MSRLSGQLVDWAPPSAGPPRSAPAASVPAPAAAPDGACRPGVTRTRRGVRRLRTAPPGPHQPEVRPAPRRWAALPARTGGDGPHRSRRPDHPGAAAPRHAERRRRADLRPARRRRHRDRVHRRGARSGVPARRPMGAPLDELLVVARARGRPGVAHARPEHPLFDRLTLRDCTWHYHGVLQPPDGAEVLVHCHRGSPALRRPVSTPGTLWSRRWTRCTTTGAISCRPPSGSSTASCPGLPAITSRSEREVVAGA